MVAAAPLSEGVAGSIESGLAGKGAATSPVALPESNSRLLATAAELRLGGTQRQWFNDDVGGQEFATLVHESLMTPRLRRAVATAAGLSSKETSQEVRAQIQAEAFSPIRVDSDPRPISEGHPSVPRSFRERLWTAAPSSQVMCQLDWSRLVAVKSTEALCSETVEEQPLAVASDGGGGSDEPQTGEGLESPPPQLVGGADDAASKRRPAPRPPVRVEINSGGQVFFGLLAPLPGHSQEEAVAIKFCNSRHMLQSEQMAAELAWHLEISAPSSRIMLKAHDSDEWEELLAASQPLCEELSDMLGRKQSMLLMQYVRGFNMHEERGAWEPSRLNKSTHSLGRLFVLDLLLGNADRLPVKSLNWRGNPSNILWSAADDSEPGGGCCCVPIDATVARRPPKLLVQEADQRADEILELVLLDRRTAQQVLLEAVSCNAAAIAAVEADWAPTEPAWAAKRAAEGGEGPPHSAVKAFHEGVCSALAQALRELGLMEMLADVLRSWLDAFHTDMREVCSKGSGLSETRQLLSLNREANKSDEVKERLASWQNLLQEKTLALREAADDWASRRSVQSVLSFRGFLGDSVLNPVADAYELLVRLRQLIDRAKVLGASQNVTRPCDLSPSPLLVGPITAVCCHLLRKLGVTLIINCTADLPPPTPTALGEDLRWSRLALEDTEEQDLSVCLEEGLRLIDEAVKSGGRVLVHCFEGKSRSVALCLAYLVTRERRPLAEALSFVKARRPQSRPNASFLRQLLALELQVLGKNSLSEQELPRGKPKLASAGTAGPVAGSTPKARDDRSAVAASAATAAAGSTPGGGSGASGSVTPTPAGSLAPATEG